MSNPLVECVPNFSEARRPKVIEEITQKIVSVPTVTILDQHSDFDHNRTVITFVGPPDAVEEAAFLAISKAGELIDLNQHTGQHPRIGATDVVPFIPISGITMQECVEIAERLGKRVAQELNIPVYLYEQAARSPERKNLENIRHGEFESLKEEIATNTARKPDFGPAELGPAGATVIGARHFLIAFNVYLTTDDISIAKNIARSVRHSSGGLRYVKAIGLLVDGRAQVSMNLTNYQGTPLATVVELIRREALRYGVNIHHSELVGLIPEDALIDSAVWYTQMDQFNPDQVLERRLYTESSRSEFGERKPATSSSAQDFLENLASGEPTPGGGSASAYSAAAAAALVAMVARLTIGKSRYRNVEEKMVAVLAQAEDIRMDMTATVAQDAEAFEAVMAAYKLPKESIEEQEKRSKAIERATVGATKVPLKVAETALKILEFAEQVVSEGNINAISDGGTAAALAHAAVKGAALNVRINVASLKDQSQARSFIDQLIVVENSANGIAVKVWETILERGNLKFQ